MSRANPTWGTPRIIGELAKLGISLCKSTVDRYRAPKERNAVANVEVVSC